MSKINQIEKALQEMDQARFQKLADAYLHRKGYKQLIPIGSVTGFDKVRKGTPDSLFALPNGKYVFAEYTTQQSGLIGKLTDDLAKCFDESSTGIPIEKIQEIVFCINTELSTSEMEQLGRETQSQGVNLNLFGNAMIAYDLLTEYPQIAKEFLGIEVDTGQILSTEEFVALYNRGFLVAPLNTNFYYREKDLERAIQELESTQIMLITGKPGVGKTRFALECCNKFFKKYPEYQIRCIFNRGPDIFNDLQTHFSETKKYLILVDDANRINKLDYILQLVRDKKDGREIRIIGTVRNYALDEVIETVKSFAASSQISLEGFDQEQIMDFVRGEFKITNMLFLERIAEIARGNPRLAVMAAVLVLKEKFLASINDASELYDRYFETIRSEIDAIRDENVIKIAAIIALFRSVDKNNDFTARIYSAFGLSKELFWERVARLNDMEVVDLWENEVVRFSDQILASYTFYLAFFKHRVLRLSTVLEQFFPEAKQELFDSLNPVIATFHSPKLIDQLTEEVGHSWRLFEEGGNRDRLLQLMESFGPLKPTETLARIRMFISDIPEHVATTSAIPKADNSYIEEPSILSILRRFHNSDESSVKIAIVLLLEYLRKKPTEFAKILHILTHEFSFNYKSIQFVSITTQQIVVDSLWEGTQEGKDTVLGRLFLLVSGQYLCTEFESTELREKNELSIITFHLPYTQDVFEFRRMVWNKVIQLYDLIPQLQREIIDSINDFSCRYHKPAASEFIKWDSIHLLSFFDSKLDPHDYRHCKIVHNMLNLCDMHRITYNLDIRKKFTTNLFELAEILMVGPTDKRFLNLGYEEFIKERSRLIERNFKTYGFKDYERFFDFCLQIKNGLKDHETYQLDEGITNVFLILADNNPELFVEVIQYYLGRGDQMRIRPYLIVDKLVKILGAPSAYTLLTFGFIKNKAKHGLSTYAYSSRLMMFHLSKGVLRRLMRNHCNFPSQREWLFAFYQVLPPTEVTQRSIREIYLLYREASLREPPHHVDYLLKYSDVDKRFFVRLVRIVLTRTRLESNYVNVLNMLFNPLTDTNKRILNLFENQIGLLEQLYLKMHDVNNLPDYDRTTFNKVLDADSGFAERYVDYMYSKKQWLSGYDDGSDYTLLWLRKNHEEIIGRIIHSIYGHEKNQKLWVSSYAEAFFRFRGNAPNVKTIKSRQKEFIEKFILLNFADHDAMKFIFRIVAIFPAEEQISHLSFYLNHNKDFRKFKELPLEPGFRSIVGSEVPWIRARMEFFKSLLPLVNSVEFLEHKLYIESLIKNLMAEEKWELRRDFIGD